jgi:hypothetical protein
MSRFRSSLRYKIGLLMLLLSLVPLAVVSAVVLMAVLGQLGRFGVRMAEAEDSLRSEVVGRNLKGAAVDTATEIDDYVLTRIIDLRRWSEDRDVIEAARQGTRVVQQNGWGNLAPDALRTKLQSGLFVPISPTIYSVASPFLFHQVERPETPFVKFSSPKRVASTCSSHDPCCAWRRLTKCGGNPRAIAASPASA